jgi:hypothetical protein
LPKTKTNDLLFEHRDQLDKQGRWTREREWTAVLNIEGVDVISGTFKLMDISNEGYAGILIGSTIAWWPLISGSLRELEFNNFDFFNDVLTEIEPWWDKTFQSTEYNWPLVCYGSFYNPTVTDVQVWNDIALSDNYTFRDMPPALYVWHIMKAIFRKAGLNVGGDIFTDGIFQRQIVAKSGKNEAFWNWNRLANSSVTSPANYYELNGDPDEFTTHAFTKEVYSYLSCLFQHYVKSVMANGQWPISPVIGETFCLPQVGASVYRYDGGVVNNPASYTALATVNYGDNIYAYAQGGISGGGATWAFNGSYRFFTNTPEDFAEEDIQHQIIGIVRGGASVVGQYQIVNDWGKNFNRDTTVPRYTIRISGNDVPFATRVELSGQTFTLLQTSSNFATGTIRVRDVIEDLYEQILASTLAPYFTIYNYGWSIELIALVDPTPFTMATNRNDIVSFSTSQGGISTYKYTVPIDSILDQFATWTGDRTVSNTDVGVEGYAFYADGNNINNRCLAMVVRNFESLREEGAILVTSDQLLQQTFDFLNGTGSLPEAVLAYSDQQGTGDWTNAAFQGTSVELTEGDNITMVVVQYVNGYFQPMVGWRDIWCSISNVTTSLQIKPTDTIENTIKNYETGEWEPDYTEIQLAHCLPNMTQQTFVKNIVNMFNLYFTYDKSTNTILFYPFSDFYGDKEFSLDITNWVEDTEWVLKPSATSKEISLEYKDDPKDVIKLAEKRTQTNRSIWAEGTTTITFDFFRTWNGSFRNNYNANRVTIPYMFSEKESAIQFNQSLYYEKRNFDFGPRILSFEGRLDEAMSLDWNVVDIPRTIWYNDYLGLDAIWTRNYLEIGDFLQRKEQIELVIWLDSFDYARIDLKRPVIFKDQYWIVSSISGWSPDEACSIVLLKMD